MVSSGNFATSTTANATRTGLDAEKLMAVALARTRRNDFSDYSFVEPLSRLLASYEDEADLSDFGRRAVHFDVMRCLKNLLRFDAVEDEHPEILVRPIPEPVFIMGLPRSGTTFLHSLLAQDPTIVVPLSWQLVYPYPWRMRPFGIDLRKSWTGLQFRFMEYLSPELYDLHPLAADAPQECTDITAQVFQSLRFDSTYRIPSYQRWLESHGHHGAYRFHKRFLQHLDAHTPGRRWVLKSPDHIFALDAVKGVYPDAKIVFLHRDPLSVLASVAKLTEVLRRPFTRRLDREEIGRQVSLSWIDGAERMIAAGDGALHLHYKDVVAAPMDAVTRLYEYCGRSLSDDARTRMQEWLQRAPKGNARRRDYSFTLFGLDEGDLRRRFSHYMDVFGVAPEWGTTGAERNIQIV
ncbi:MAG TPA: sulfotransferase [Rhizomicrobium sp.]|nr:sulfotransferase [Rhizomicrobium sp.]